MQQMKRAVLLLAGAAALGACAMANAQSADPLSRENNYGLWGWNDSSTAESRPQSWIPYTSYGYVGVGIGRSDYDLASCAPGFSCDDNDTGYKVFTGGKFSRFLGVEAAYVYLGRAESNGGGTRAQGVNLSLVGNVPVGEYFNIYGKVGGIYGWTRTSSAIPGPGTGNEEGFNMSYGAGVQFDINRNWAVQGDWDHYRFDYQDRNDDAQLYSVNLVYKF